MPLPRSFPFFHRDPGFTGFSALPGLRDTEGDVAVEFEWEKGEELEIVTGGRGNLWLFCFPSSCQLVSDSEAVPADLG